MVTLYYYYHYIIIISIIVITLLLSIVPAPKAPADWYLFGDLTTISPTMVSRKPQNLNTSQLTILDSSNINIEWDSAQPAPKAPGGLLIGSSHRLERNNWDQH